MSLNPENFEEIEAHAQDTMHLPFYEALEYSGLNNTVYEMCWTHIRRGLMENDIHVVLMAEVDHAMLDW